MSADATINIDVMLSNLATFKNDASLIDDILSKLGVNTGEKMDESFKQETIKIQKQAEDTKQKIDETIGKKTEAKVSLDDKELLKDVEKVKGKLKDIPEKTSTKVSAEVDDQEIKVLQDDLAGIPSKTETKIEADTNSAIRNIEKLEESTGEASEGFSNLKEVIEGTFIGEQLSEGFDLFKESSFDVIGRVTDLQNASNKLTNTIGLNADQTKKYRDAVNDFYDSGFVESMDEAAETVSEVNTQLGDMPSDQLQEVSKYASILQDQFDMDMGESLRGINSLMTNFNMDVGQAFDYMIKGAQSGLDKTDELGDNLAEYGQIWSQAGFDAKSMFSILDNGLKSGAYNLDKVNDFVKEFTISLNDGRIEENLGSFSKGTQKIFKEFKSGKATASDVFQNVISDLKNTKNQQEKLTTASTIWSSLGEDNAMKVIESLGNVNDTFDNVSGTAAKAKENTEQLFSVRLRSDIRKITDELTPMGEKLLDLAEKNLPKLSDTGKNVFSDIYKALDKTFSYLTNHGDDLVEIGGNVKKIGEAFLSGAWKEGKELFFDIADLFGLVDDKSKALKDPLDAINEIVGKIADHKDEIKLFGEALVIMFAVKKGYEFITMIKEAKKALMELTAIEKVTDFIGGGGFSFGKKSGGKKVAEAGEEIIEDVLPKTKGATAVAEEAVEDVAKSGVLSKLGSFGKSGSFKLLGDLGKFFPYLDILSSATELFGKGSTGSKLGGFAGSLGGTAGGAAAGAALGSVVPVIGTGVGGAIGAAIGSFSGTDLGEKLGKEIEKGLKKKKINLDDIFKGEPSKKKFFQTYKKELEELLKNTKSSEKSYDKLSAATDKYFQQKEKNSKHDLDTLLKNGDITKKQYDEYLKEDKKKNNAQKKNLKDNFKQMSQENDRYNKEVADINDKWDKKKEEQLSASAKKYGKNSKKYKEQEKQVTAQIEKERNKELLKARKGHEDNMTVLTENTNKMVVSDLKISKGKQLDLLDDLKKNTKRISREKMKEVIQASAKERDQQIKDANKAYEDTTTAAKKKRDDVIAAADREYYDNHSISKKQHDEIVKKANDTYASTKKTAEDQRDAIVKQATDTHNDVVTQATQQAGEHKDAVDAETGDVKTSWDTLKSGLGTVVEGISHSIGKLIHSLNKNWGQDLIDFKFDAAHAQGSSGLSHDEIALVGEEGFELAHHPSQGIFPVGVSGPEIRPLQAGTSILPHHMSKEFLAMAKGLPAHKDGKQGWISGAYDWLKEKTSDVWSFVTDGAEKVYDTIADKLGISDFLDGLGDTAGYKVAAGGISNIKDKIIDYAQSFFDKFTDENGGGSFDGAMADNVFKYLVDIANAASKKYGMSITSGYRPGDPYYHGKHQAIDIAYPASMNGSAKYFDPANWVFEHFADKVGYVITQGKVRDRTGQSGQPATSEWEPWPDNDHYDHLHITGKLGAGDIFKAGASPAGLGAERWRGKVIQAAKAVGFPTDKAHIDRIISQIQTESGGNEKAVQGGYTDINTITGDLAKGLMQTISATFNAYKMPGHNDIFNGYDNILAGLRYIMARYGTGSGFFSSIGMGHGYANGGEVNGPELAWIGEDPSYAKEFIINPAKPSADSLIAKAIQSREQFRPANVSNGSNHQGSFLTSEISDQSLQRLSEALENRPVKVESILDGQKVSKSVDQHNGSTFRRKLYTGGRSNVGR